MGEQEGEKNQQTQNAMKMSQEKKNPTVFLWSLQKTHENWIGKESAPHYI